MDGLLIEIAYVVSFNRVATLNNSPLEVRVLHYEENFRRHQNLRQDDEVIADTLEIRRRRRD